MPPESAGHAPGHDISGEGGSTRQRHQMGEGGSPMGGDFGVEKLSQTNGALMSHGSHVPHDGIHLRDEERAGPPGIKQGSSSMRATAHSYHGPHMHTSPKMGKTRGK